ncbi:MAG: HEPN domain-containing protein [Betaproteobacteria bacterium]|nr:HEPN domain-containing protein [Betaproteobacteria bacterium]
MAEPSVAEILLAAACRDEQAFRALAALPDMNDTVIGFHAHQSVEKALKAVLAHTGVAFRRTHNVGELLDLLRDARIPLPVAAEHLDELDPYAVEARYGLVEPGALNRSAATAMVTTTIAWAQDRLSKPSEPAERQ